MTECRVQMYHHRLLFFVQIHKRTHTVNDVVAAASNIIKIKTEFNKSRAHESTSCQKKTEGVMLQQKYRFQRPYSEHKNFWDFVRFFSRFRPQFYLMVQFDGIYLVGLSKLMQNVVHRTCTTYSYPQIKYRIFKFVSKWDLRHRYDSQSICEHTVGFLLYSSLTDKMQCAPVRPLVLYPLGTWALSNVCPNTLYGFRIKSFIFMFRLVFISLFLMVRMPP